MRTIWAPIVVAERMISAGDSTSARSVNSLRLLDLQLAEQIGAVGDRDAVHACRSRATAGRRR